jgi:hypothetical protein
MKNQNLVQSVSFITMLAGLVLFAIGLISHVQSIGVSGGLLAVASITVNILVSNFKTSKS